MFLSVMYFVGFVGREGEGLRVGGELALHYFRWGEVRGGGGDVFVFGGRGACIGRGGSVGGGGGGGGGGRGGRGEGAFGHGGVGDGRCEWVDEVAGKRLARGGAWGLVGWRSGELRAVVNGITMDLCGKCPGRCEG